MFKYKEGLNLIQKILKTAPNIFIKIALILSFSLSGAFDAYISLVLSNVYFPQVTMGLSYIEYLAVASLSSWLIYELVVYIIFRIINKSKHKFNVNTYILKKIIAIFTILLNIILAIASLIYLLGDIYYDLFSILFQVLFSLIVYYLCYLYIEKNYVKPSYKSATLLMYSVPALIISIVVILGGVL